MVDATDSHRNSYNPDDSIGVLAGVGPERAARLIEMGITSLGDLVTTYPIRYMDLSNQTQISDVRVGQTVSISGVVKEVTTPPSRRGRASVVTIAVFDGSGVLHGVWFNQKHIASAIKPGNDIALSGKAAFKFGRIQIEGPAWELLTGSSTNLHTQGIIPVHPSVKGLTPRQIRVWVRQALDLLSDDDIDNLDPVPRSVRRRRQLMSRSAAIRNIHYPSDLEHLKMARGRIKYEEVLVLQTAVAQRKARVQSGSGTMHSYMGDSLSALAESMRITPTADQAAAVEQIIADMKMSSPMRRLLQGDVGSGKTFVAGAALFHALMSEGQTAVMAPTEVLATQLHAKLSPSLERAGFHTALLTGSTPSTERAEILAGLESGSIRSVVGTHTLIQRAVQFQELTFAVIDEQHRFGVEQRDTLTAKGMAIDLLVMTATPIPRTLALTVYGELELTTLRTIPEGRKPIKTEIVSESKLQNVYSEIQRRVAEGQQAYIVYPLIEDSPDLDAPSLESEFHQIQGIHLPGISLGLLHGRLRPEEKGSVLDDFQNGHTKVLVSTTVIEVGIDVPNATAMVIRGPDRYGLSQLHQLRGRVGRGSAGSICYVVDDERSEEVSERLISFANIQDGFELAELDLEARGEGDILGVKQSGFAALRLVRLPRDMTILEQARDDATQIVSHDPGLNAGDHATLRDHAKTVFPFGSGA